MGIEGVLGAGAAGMPVALAIVNWEVKDTGSQAGR